MKVRRTWCVRSSSCCRSTSTTSRACSCSTSACGSTTRCRSSRRPSCTAPCARRASASSSRGSAARGSTGGLLYYDCTTDDARLTLENMIDARALGADHRQLHARGERCLARAASASSAPRCSRSTARTPTTAPPLPVRAKVTINATGPWTDEVRRLAGEQRDPARRPRACTWWSTPRGCSPRHAVVMKQKQARRLLHPVGRTAPSSAPPTPSTTRRPRTCTPTPPTSTTCSTWPTTTFPRPSSRPTTCWRPGPALRPLIKPDSDVATASDVSREHHILERPGLITIAGGKLTTYRRMAAEVVDHAGKQLGAHPRRAAPTSGRCPAPPSRSARRATPASRSSPSGSPPRASSTQRSPSTWRTPTARARPSVVARVQAERGARRAARSRARPTSWRRSTWRSTRSRRSPSRTCSAAACRCCCARAIRGSAAPSGWRGAWRHDSAGTSAHAAREIEHYRARRRRHPPFSQLKSVAWLLCCAFRCRPCPRAPHRARRSSSSAMIARARLDDAARSRRLRARPVAARAHRACAGGDAAPHPPDAVVWPTSTEEVAAIVRARGAHRHADRAVRRRLGRVRRHAADPRRHGRRSQAHALASSSSTRTPAPPPSRPASSASTSSTSSTAAASRSATSRRRSCARRSAAGWRRARPASSRPSTARSRTWCAGSTFVDGRGEVHDRRGRRLARLAQLLVGTEGTLGIITRATLHGAPAPEARALSRLVVPARRRRLRGDPPPPAARPAPGRGAPLRRARLVPASRREGATHGAQRAPAPPAPRRSICRCWRPTGKSVVGEWKRRAIGAGARPGPSWSTGWPSTLLPYAQSGCLLIVGFEGERGAHRGRGARRRRRARARRRTRSRRRARASAGSRTATPSASACRRCSTPAPSSTPWRSRPRWDRLLELYRAVREAVVAARVRHGALLPRLRRRLLDLLHLRRARQPARADAERKYDDIWRAGLAAATGSARPSATTTASACQGAVHARGARRGDGDLSRAQGRARSARHHEPGEDGPVSATLDGAPFWADRLAHAVGAPHVLVESGRALRAPGRAGRARRRRAHRRRGRRARRRRARRRQRRGVDVDLSRMCNVLHLDETSLLVSAQAGITVDALEARPRRARPDARSALPSLVARAHARRAARRRRARRRRRRASAASSRPAPASQALLPDGTEIATRLAPRKATGPDLMHALVGARGTLGLITAATLRVQRRRRCASRRRSRLPTLPSGAGGGARAAGARRAPARPAGRRHRACSRCTVDGPAPLVAAELALAERTARELGGEPVPHPPPPRITARPHERAVPLESIDRQVLAPALVGRRRCASSAGTSAAPRHRHRTRARSPPPPAPPLYALLKQRLDPDDRFVAWPERSAH